MYLYTFEEFKFSSRIFKKISTKSVLVLGGKFSAKGNYSKRHANLVIPVNLCEQPHRRSSAFSRIFRQSVNRVRDCLIHQHKNLIHKINPLKHNSRRKSGGVQSASRFSLQADLLSPVFNLRANLCRVDLAIGSTTTIRAGVLIAFTPC